jgi:hypothetical protein
VGALLGSGARNFERFVGDPYICPKMSFEEVSVD